MLGEVVLERVDDDAERDLPFELGGPSPEDQPTGGSGAVGQFDEEPCLADAGLADDLDGEAAAVGRVQGGVKPGEFLATPDDVGESPAASAHRVTPSAIR
jgi:hypothetical protein